MKLDQHERRLFKGLALAACLIGLALIAGAATVDMTAPMNSDVVVNGKTIAKVGADGVTINIRPATQPAPPPAPYIPPQGIAVQRVTSGIGSIKLASNTWFIPSANAARVTVTGNGVLVTSPGGVANCTVAGFTFDSSSATSDCLRIVANNLQCIRFYRCTFKGGRDNIVIQGTDINGPCVNLDITFEECSFLDPLGNVDRSGQNIFIANAKGVKILKFFAMNAGFKQSPRTLYAHAFYCVAGNQLVVCEDGFVVNPQNVGLHLRGSRKHDYDPPNGDPGPIARRVVVYNAPIAFALNGDLATLEDCLALAGPHVALKDNTGGECLIYGSVGKLTARRNTLLHSPIFQTGYDVPPLRNSPWSRGGLTDAQRLAKDIAWQWTKPTAWDTADGKPDPSNVVNLAKVVNLDDLVTRGRNGEDVVGLLAEARRRAAGAN